MVEFQDYSEFDVATPSGGKEVSWQLGASQPTCPARQPSRTTGTIFMFPPALHLPYAHALKLRETPTRHLNELEERPRAGGASTLALSSIYT